MTNLDKIATHPLQTSAWAAFRRAWGNEVMKTPYGIITVHRIPFTKYKIGIFEKGPEPTRDQLSELRALGKKNNLIFIKLEPNISKSPKLIKLMEENGAVRGKTLFTPSTFWIDLTPSEKELMESFSSKTRYNIRVAQRKGVMVKEDPTSLKLRGASNSPGFKRYLELTQETVGRQGFFAHSEKYHKLMWEILNKAGVAHLITATYKGEIITTWILFEWRDFLYYPYGASTQEHKNVMANNLMMWEAIKFGKKNNLKTFDLWGREEGKGFTKFKEGYNPRVIEFLGTWDLVINKPLYAIYRFAEKLRWRFLKTFAKLGLSKQRF